MRTNNLHPYAILAFCLSVFLASCASETPSVAEGLAAGYVTIETLAESVITASDSGLITPADRAYARTQLQIAKDVLDTGTELLRIGSEPDARLALSRAVLAIHQVQELLP